MDNLTETPGRRSSTRVLLTAAEAYPALEEAFLDARSHIKASFMVFDPTTGLRSERARSVGKTWADLITDTLRRGVAITMTISDFDPIARAAAHRASWASVRAFEKAAADVPDARLSVRAVRHDAQTGIGPRLCIWPLIVHKQFRACGWLNKQVEADRNAALADMPDLEKALVRRSGGRMRPRLWPVPVLSPGVHHQKLAVIDSRLLYIGGLDLDERRFDSPDHDRPGEETWHDVQLMLQGPVVAEAEAHLDSFLDVVSGKARPPVTRRLLRTLSRRREKNATFFGPEPVVEDIAAAHEAMIRRARNLIYFETQYFRDRMLTQKLELAAKDNPHLSMILILPGAPDDVAFDGKRTIDARFGEYLQSRALRRLIRAFGPRLFIGGVAQRRRVNATGREALHGAPLVYVHAKVSIFDDSAAIVSSANLNGRSLRWDTEAGVMLNTPHEMADLRPRVMAHWLPPDAGEEYFALGSAAAAWRRLAYDNARRPPDQRRGFILPYDVAAAERFGRPLPAIPEEMV